MTTVAEAVSRGRQVLSRLADVDGGLESSLLLAHVLEKDRSWLYTWPETVLSPDQLTRFEKILRKRSAGYPFAYITGQREFWSLELEVTEDTLIPRPETELLVSTTLMCRAPAARCRVLELGTGTGAIAIALAKERPAWSITAIERSAAALAVARRNVQRHGIASVKLLQGSWYDQLGATQRFGIILSNPPYVAESDPHLAQGDLRYEPRGALAAGPRGLDDLASIIGGAPDHLATGGHLLLEHGMDQGSDVRGLMAEAGLREVQTHKDLAGLERVTTAHL